MAFCSWYAYRLIARSYPRYRKKNIDQISTARTPGIQKLNVLLSCRIQGFGGCYSRKALVIGKTIFLLPAFCSPVPHSKGIYGQNRGFVSRFKRLAPGRDFLLISF
jgi:hypothetical protein